MKQTKKTSPWQVCRILFLTLITLAAARPTDLLAQCGTPSGLAAAPAGATSVSLSWSVVSGASGYTLSIENANNNPVLYSVEFPVTSSPYLATLPASGDYKFKVRAKCGGNHGSWSEKFFFNLAGGGSGGGGGGGGSSCIAPTGLTATATSATMATLSWNSVAGNSGYVVQVERQNNPVPFSSEFSSPSNSTTTVLPGAGTYKFKVRTKCTGGVTSDWSLWFTFTTSAPPPPAPGNYCASASTAPWQDWIGNVKVGNAEKNSGKSQYSNFSATTFNIAAGATANVRLTAKFTGATFAEYWKIWIDLNNDGVFSEGTETVLTHLMPKPPTGSSNARVFSTFTIPAGTAPGPKRMRVSMKRGAYATPCETFPNGEVEDYTVNVLPSFTAAADRTEIAELTPVPTIGKVFPNPTSGLLYLPVEQLSTHAVQVQVFTIAGQLKMETQLQSEPSFELDLSSLPQGVYFLRFFADGRVLSTQKVVVEK